MRSTTATELMPQVAMSHQEAAKGAREGLARSLMRVIITGVRPPKVPEKEEGVWRM